MKVTRMLLIRQLATLYQIRAICKQTDVKDCDKCPYDGNVCGRDKSAPDGWDLEALLKTINEWEGDKNV